MSDAQAYNNDMLVRMLFYNMLVRMLFYKLNPIINETMMMMTEDNETHPK